MHHATLCATKPLRRIQLCSSKKRDSSHYTEFQTTHTLIQHPSILHNSSRHEWWLRSRQYPEKNTANITLAMSLGQYYNKTMLQCQYICIISRTDSVQYSKAVRVTYGCFSMLTFIKQKRVKCM